MADQAKERRRRKRGTIKVTEAERIRQDAERWQLERAAGQRAQGALFAELTAEGVKLPDDDKPATAGRPVGARTASPLEYRRYVLSQGGDYLLKFARLAQADTLALAQILGCTPLEALAMQQKLGSTAAPYIYAPQRAPLDEQEREYFAGMVFMAGAAGGAAIAASSSRPALEQSASKALAALAGAPPDTLDLQAFSVATNDASEPPASEQDEEAP